MEKLFYRIPISVLRDDVKYDSFVISSDVDMHVLFHCRRQFPEMRTPELLAKFVNVASSSGDSNWNLHSTGHLASSSAMPVGSSGCFRGAQFPPFVPVFGEVRAPDGVEDALHDDDDVEPATIADDSDEETPRTTPPVGRGASSSSTNQYPLYFSALHLDAMAPQEDPSVPVGFGARDTQNAVAEFQDKEEVVLSVKTYSIRHGVEYKVLESDNRKYYGKRKEFGSGSV
ncbi:uncharacterized protein LOC107466860 [Arachis duranensis]|uniref:Uncharacterized protein LOC107466860 n=1 Tax=Arachis duranensis TaxID=130453 RepID=A0A6P4BFD8_ARADU|nr:uncharacterized protein LOC107466860 [Arachis duranensis]